MHRDRIVALAAFAALTLAPAAQAARPFHHHMQRLEFTLAPNGMATAPMGRHQNVQLTSVRVNGRILKVGDLNGNMLMVGDQFGNDAVMYGQAAVFRFVQGKDTDRRGNHTFTLRAASLATHKLRVVVTYYGYNTPR